MTRKLEIVAAIVSGLGGCILLFGLIKGMSPPILLPGLAAIILGSSINLVLFARGNKAKPAH